MDVTFLEELNNNRNGHLMKNLNNNFRMGRYEYPKDITSAYYPDINCMGDSMLTVGSKNDGM